MMEKREYRIRPQLRNTGDLKLVGMKRTVSMENFDPSGLWRSLMPRLGEIGNPVSRDLFSIAIYGPGYFSAFDPKTPFEKWAAREVSEFGDIPSEMGSLEIPAGLYAVFPYKGLSSDRSVYEYIFGSWLPTSGYQLDHRPHFEVLGEKYRNNDPESEEEIWVPVVASKGT